MSDRWTLDDLLTGTGNGTGGNRLIAAPPGMTKEEAVAATANIPLPTSGDLVFAVSDKGQPVAAVSMEMDDQQALEHFQTIWDGPISEAAEAVYPVFQSLLKANRQGNLPELIQAYEPGLDAEHSDILERAVKEMNLPELVIWAVGRAGTNSGVFQPGQTREFWPQIRERSRLLSHAVLDLERSRSPE